ncbi:MAG: 2-deoxy-D-gluconate 3-dehydrogenase [Proteobacteria bacterium]|jgi:Dehydrogenases with different specificities (related to short-chain alcohol dehydrogenases)|nr:MAG: 2-deoxy-D-gluconate 3-dehydrogenase [Pseudomonadota bacterium]
MGSSLFDLTGRVAIVTGGNGGIGLGMATGLAEAGAAIVIAARDQKKSAEAAEKLQKLGARVATVEVDVKDQNSVKRMVQATFDRFQRVDILVANAGINIRKPPQDVSAEEWQAVLDVNLNGPFFCAQAVYPAMKAQGGGKIITIGSMTSIFGVPFAPAYSATKGGVVQLTRSLATAWAKDNIQVNCVLPGWIDTDLTRQARKQVQGLHERVEARTPAGRWGEPKDFAGVAVFLASHASDFITGAAIPVDGGYSVSGG